MAAEYELTLSDYLAIIKRRALLLVGCFVGIFGISVIVALVIPPVYESTGTILVESQQIPVDLVATTITSYADERIEVIRQRVMTRENLVRIIDKYKLYDEGQVFTTSEKIDDMRKAIRVTLLNTNVKGKGQAAIAFKLSFEHRRPETANKVANELVTLFLDANIKQRTERASETTEFLTQEAEKLKTELEVIEGRLAAYKQEHGDALPEHQALRMNMLQRTESEIKEVERDYKTAQEELRFLDIELAAARAGVTPRTGAPLSTASGPQDLGGLKAEYARLLSLYTDAHPDVRAIKRKIDALEASGVGAKDKGAPVSLDVARVETKIGATQARVDSLASQLKTLRGKLAAYEKQVLQAPQVERGLVTLMRDHDNAKKKYEEVRAKQMSARISENLEQDNKAERFILLEPPLMPDKPIKPNRKMMLLVGLFLALGGSGGVVFILETMQQRVRGADALVPILGRRVLATIPYLHTQAEHLRRRWWIKRITIGTSIGLLLLLLILHFAYMPLDILLMKLLARFE